MDWAVTRENKPRIEALPRCEEVRKEVFGASESVGVGTPSGGAEGRGDGWLSDSGCDHPPSVGAGLTSNAPAQSIGCLTVLHRFKLIANPLFCFS